MMKKKTLNIALITLLTLSLAIGLAGCGGKDKAKKTSGDTLNVIDSEWYGLDAYQMDSSANLQQCVGESLFEWDVDKNEISDGVCTDWKVSEDGKTATFNVPEGMYYSTGEQVEPEDIVASIKHGQEVSPYADGYKNIESMEVDGRKVTLHLTSFKSDMLYNLCGDFMCIIDKDELDKMSNEELMWGCHPYGMYSLEKYVSGSEVKLVRNDKYKTASKLVKNQGKANFKKIKIKFNVESYTALESLKDGSVDMICHIDNDSKNQLKDSDTIKVEDVTYPECNYFELNTNKGLLQDKNLRLAIALLIDREKLCELTDGQTVPAYSIVFDSMQNFSKEAKADFKNNYANDVKRAQKLLKDAGWTEKDKDGYLTKDGQIFELNYYASSSDVSRIIAEGLQGQMAEYGIKLNLNLIDWNYVHEQVKSDDYDIAREGLAWAEPILILNRCYYDQNAPGVLNGQKDKVYEIASTIDSNERTKKIGELQKEMFKNIDIIPIYTEKQFMAHNKELKGFEIKKDGSYAFNDLTW